MNDYKNKYTEIYILAYSLGYTGKDNNDLDSLIELGRWIKTWNLKTPKGMKLVDAIEYGLTEIFLKDVKVHSVIIKLSKFEKMIEKSKGNAIIDHREFQHKNQCKSIENKWCRKWIRAFATAKNPIKWMKKREMYNRGLRIT